MSRSKVISEIDRRTTDTSKLIALEARKVAILEMVAGLIDEAVQLMRNEGFKSATVPTLAQPYVGATVIQEASLPPVPVPVITNPCVSCGQEASGFENMPDGGKKYLCRAHYRARLAEKQEEATTKSLLGSEGTLYQRPQQTPSVPVKKMIIQADPLLGTAGTGNASVLPPDNPVLDD